MACQATEQLWETSSSSDETLVAVVLDALGYADEPVQRTPEPPRTAIERDQAPFCVTSTWHLETLSCTIELDRAVVIEIDAPPDERAEMPLKFRAAFGEFG